MDLDEGSAKIALRLTHYLVMALGIAFPFPQLDVHFDSPIEESIECLPRAG